MYGALVVDIAGTELWGRDWAGVPDDKFVQNHSLSNTDDVQVHTLSCMHTHAHAYAVVKLGFTEEKVSVKESEGEARVCVTISHTIARTLNFIIIHSSITAGIHTHDQYMQKKNG